MSEYGKRNSVPMSQTVTPRDTIKNTKEMDNYYKSVRDYKRL